MAPRLNYGPRDLDPAAIARSLAERWGLPYADPIRRPHDVKPFRVGQIPKHSSLFDSSMPDLFQLGEAPVARRLIERHMDHIQRIIRENPEPFRVREVLSINNGWVGVGSPINLGYEAVPVYINQNGETRLVFAYRSKSQESWRRFAGYSANHGIYWKGNPTPDHVEEHTQNFHFEIQRAIDESYAYCRMTSKPTVLRNQRKLEDLGINAVAQAGDEDAVAEKLIIRAEQQVQNTMFDGIRRLTFAEAGDTVKTLVSFWWSGDAKEGAYGRHLNLVVSNSRYYMCIAVTDEGLFMKYLQPKDPSGINIVGAPVKAGLLTADQSWLLAPLLEYSEQVVSAIEKRRLQGARQARACDTVMFDVSHGAVRQRILGLHDDPSSPLFELNAGLYRIYRLMRTERYRDIDEFLRSICSNGHELPLADHLPMRVVHADHVLCDRRNTQLTDACQFAIDSLLTLPNGKSEIPSAEVERMKRSFDLTDREAATLIRYARFMVNKMVETKYDTAEFERSVYLREQFRRAVDRVERHLSGMAERWAKDYQESTDFIARS